MRSNEFIAEARVTPYKYENLDLDRAMEMLNKYATQALPLLSKPIWRGMSTHDKKIVLINPDSGERKSQNTSNYYTILIDSSPYMQGWPKRSASLICSSDKFYAKGYTSGGNLYAIFPLDNAKIAVCPKRDMWETNVKIPELHVNFKGAVSNMDNFNDWLDNLGLKDSPHSLSNAHLNPGVQRLCQTYKQDPKNFIPLLQKALSPQKTGFKLMTIPEFIAAGITNKSHECWIGDNVIAIRHDLWEQFVTADKERRGEHVLPMLPTKGR